MELKNLRKFSLKNAYPHKFIDKCFFKFLNKPKVTAVPKKQIRIALPYLGNVSNITRTKLT